jgi:hypothetical protein
MQEVGGSIPPGSTSPPMFCTRTIFAVRVEDAAKLIGKTKAGCVLLPLPVRQADACNSLELRFDGKHANELCCQSPDKCCVWFVCPISIL